MALASVSVVPQTQGLGGREKGHRLSYHSLGQGLEKASAKRFWFCLTLTGPV